MLFFMTPKPVATTNTATSLRSSFDIAFLPQCLLVFCLGVIMNGVAAYTTLFAQQRHVTTIAWFFFAAAVVGVLMRPFVGNLFDQRGPFIIMIPSVVCLIVGLLLIINVHTGWQLILAGVFYGAADGAIFPTAQSWSLNAPAWLNANLQPACFSTATTSVWAPAPSSLVRSSICPVTRQCFGDCLGLLDFICY